MDWEVPLEVQKMVYMTELEVIYHATKGHPSYPASDMAVDAIPLFLEVRKADAGSEGSTFDRLFRRLEAGSIGASESAGACSGLASWAGAFRFFDETLGCGGGAGAGVGGICWLLGSELDEPAESLAAERVTLGDMRTGINRGMHDKDSMRQGSCER